MANTDAFLVPKLPVVAYPPRVSDRECAEWLDRWQSTEAARDYRHARRGLAHALQLQPDGSFRIDLVQAGTYELHVRKRGLAELVRDVVVPATHSDENRRSVDVGTLFLDGP